MSRPTPARPKGHCDDDAAWAEFVRQYGGQPRSAPHLTDFALANAIFMADRNDLDLIVYQTAAKERLRWLSIELAKALEVDQDTGARLKHLERREADLLEANNRYLDRARRAEAAVKHLQASIEWRAGARLDRTMPLLKPEIVAQIREEAELDIEMMPDDEDPTTAHGLQLLCDWQDRARAADKAEKRDLEPAADELLKTSAGVAAVVEESGGYWHACSGCYETEDGHPSQNYSHSRIFACQVGAGCSECGGLGVKWDDLSYVDDMVREFLEEEKAPSRALCTVADDVEMDCPVFGEPLRPSDMCLSDVDLGICHTACLEGSPVVSLETSEPLPEGAPAPAPYRYGDI